MGGRGYVDLHCHYVPGVDDGVRSLEQGLALVERLGQAGFERVVATPHIRTAMFDNPPEALRTAHAAFVEAAQGRASIPSLGLGAEHFFDDVFWTLVEAGRAIAYPGGHAVLVELPPEFFPVRLGERFFDLRMRGLHPVLAHPERYQPLFRESSLLDGWIEVGVLPLLDVMSLVGRYGRAPQRAAERLLDEGAYFAACSDAHRPEDVDVVVEGIERLKRRVGEDGAQELLGDNPRRILAGTIDD